MVTQCPHCEKKFTVPDEYLNRQCKCVKCKEPFVVAESRYPSVTTSIKPKQAPPTIQQTEPIAVDGTETVTAVAIIILVIALFIVAIIALNSRIINYLSPEIIILYIALWLVSVISFTLILRWVLGFYRIERDLSNVKAMVNLIKEGQCKQVDLLQEKSESISKLQVRCPACSAQVKVPGTLLGKTIQCAKCQHNFKVTR